MNTPFPLILPSAQDERKRQNNNEQAARAAVLTQAITALKIALAEYESEFIRLTKGLVKCNKN